MVLAVAAVLAAYPLALGVAAPATWQVCGMRVGGCGRLSRLQRRSVRSTRYGVPCN